MPSSFSLRQLFCFANRLVLRLSSRIDVLCLRDMSQDGPPILLSSLTSYPHEPSSNSPPPRAPVQSDGYSRYIPEHVVIFCTRNAGLLYVASAQLFFAFMNLTVKYFLSITPVTVYTLIGVRMVVTSIGCILGLYVIGDPNPFLGPPEIRYMLSARGIVGFGGLFGNYQSFKSLSVSDSTAIQFLAPSLTALLGYLFLSESLSRRELVAGACCLVGVLLVSRPPFIFGSAGEPSPPDGSDVPLIPGEGGNTGASTPARMVAVGWAFQAVFSASMACECDTQSLAG